MGSVKESYKAFLNTPRGVEAYHRFKRVLYTRDDSLVQTLDANLLQFLPAAQREVVRVCDVGGGDGERAIKILSFLNGKLRNRFELDLVEQSVSLVEQFKQRRPKTFCQIRALHELFEEAALPRRYYDLVLVIHSIFTFASDTTVDKMLSLHKPDGNILVVTNSPLSFLGGLKLRMDSDFEDRRYELDDLQHALRQRGVYFFSQPFETTWAIDATHWERDMRIILDWISLGRYRQFTRLRRSEIEEYISSMTKRDGSRVLFSESEVALVIGGLNR